MTAISKPNEFQYKPLYKPNQLIYGTGQTAVITGWTIKDAIAKKLNPSEFAVVGQLYSPTRGISLLIRNLLANPHVRYLVILNATKEDRNAGSGNCLLDFFRHGVEEGTSDTGRHCWVIRSSIKGYIDIEIPLVILEQLRKEISVAEADSITQAVSLVKSYGSKTQEPWGTPLEFPMANDVGASGCAPLKPGPRYGHRIQGRTIAETWVKIIHRIKTTGTIRPTGYDGYWQELIDLMAVVTAEPPEFYFPQPNYLPCDRDFIQEYIHQILDDAPVVEGVKYTYGQRLRSWFGRDQIEQVITKLIGEIDAASAVMSLWDVKDHEKGGSPCLNHIWLRVVDNELSLTATLRSNDMFSAWAANAFGLRALQQYVKDQIAKRGGIQLKMGPLITVSQSAHIYDDCYDYADRIIKNQYQKLINSEQKQYADSIGNFLIETENTNIIVKQTTPGSGEVIATYSGKNAMSLARKICSDNPSIQPSHAVYLGIELEKAWIAIKEDKNYQQL
ncbi:MAG: thymidylate synthase [Moorea sp. SIO4E2]|uniref:thymidylate synthase n=1 Tax=Moorena sp. SIO4E2 TaxID=2607826 RepID=UPI0013BB1C56|nr:thymidylate synthase [Moorena sp. SIO4E2]NEQ07320.1 thymidylate synthase [Moorena sp. SIO4E2]